MPKSFFKERGWAGINRRVARRDGRNFLYECQNLDTNTRRGAATVRRGYASTIDTTTTDLDRIYNYRDEAWGKDVVLAFDKDSVTANRRLVLYTQNLGTGGTYAKGSSYSYGDVELGDDLTFLFHRGGVRIGTGTGANNKALFAGYIDRSGDNAMFNGQISFADFFVTKQQWVQQASLIGQYTSEIVWDATREKYYMLTQHGIEIRDSDFYLERVIGDVGTYEDANGYRRGNVALAGDYLVAVGQTIGAVTTKVVTYFIEDDYRLLYSNTKSGAEFYHNVWWDTSNSKLYYTYEDAANGYITEDDLGLSAAANRYTGDTSLGGLSSDGTYVYACDENNQNIVRMLIAAPYTTSTYNHALSDVLSIVLLSSTLYYIGRTGGVDYIYSTATGTFNSKTQELDISNQPLSSSSDRTGAKIGLDENNYIVISGENFYDLTSPGAQRHVRYDSTDSFSIQGFWPTKVSMLAQYVGSGTKDVTYFYGISIIDIYDQEYHLIRGAKTSADADDASDNGGVYVQFFVQADGEKYSDQTSPSSDPTQANSIWNDFRRIKSFRIYRAYSSTLDASEPETTYRFLREFDVDDTKWVEQVNNEFYQFSFRDRILEDEMSSVSYEEASGLPERFKPYYTNWQHATRIGDVFYFGNCRTDEEQNQLIIESTPNSPDVLYQLDTNISFFDVDDGDEIKGMSSVWNRMVVFKSTKAGIFNGPEKEFVYNIGLGLFGGYISHNNRVFFYSNEGLYELTTNGYQRISLPVDEMIDVLTPTGMSVVVYKFANKILFHFKGSLTFAYNLEDGTWNKYLLNSTGNTINYVANGIDDTVLLATSEGGIHLFGEATQDASNAISIILETHEDELGDGFLDVIVNRLLLSSAIPDSDSLTATLTYKNRNGVKTIVKTFDEDGGIVGTVGRYLSGVFGQSVSFKITGSVSPTDPSSRELVIDAVGVEFDGKPLRKVVGQ